MGERGSRWPKGRCGPGQQGTVGLGVRHGCWGGYGPWAHVGQDGGSRHRLGGGQVWASGKGVSQGQAWPGWRQPRGQTRLGWAGLVRVPTGVCWRRPGRPTRPATSSGWAQTAGAPRSPLCCTWRRWPRAPSLSSPRGCPCEVGPAARTARPLPSPGTTHHRCQRHPGGSFLSSPRALPLPLLVSLHPVFPLPWLTASLCSGSGIGSLSGHT